MTLAVPDSSKFDWVHFLARFFDGLTYDKIGLWSFWFFKIDRVHYFYDHLTYDKNGPFRSPFFKIWLSTFFDLILWQSNLRQNWPLDLMIFQKLIEYIICMIFWPTTKMALAVPDLSKFDWVHFWLDSLMVQPTTKLAFGLYDFQ